MRDIEEIIKRYHFNECDKAKLEALYMAVRPLIENNEYYICKGDEVHALISLGDGIDQLVFLYEKMGAIEEAYMVDCIGTHILLQGYSTFIERIEAETGLFVQSLEFLGDKYPLELVKEFMEELKPEKIKMKESYQLSPSKTVSLVLEMAKEAPKNKNACNICSNCGNVTCLQRNVKTQTCRKKFEINKSDLPKTYGNQVIFN